MDTKSTRKRRLVTGVTIMASVVVVASLLFACSSNTSSKTETESSDTTTEATADVSTSYPAAQADEAMAPETVPEADSFGVITAEAWKEIYPNEYLTYLMNANNVPPEYAEITAEEPDVTSVGIEEMTDFTSTKVDYLAEDQYPEIKTLGKGYGYAKYYTEPAGHTYSLWTIEHNGRLGDVRGGNSKGKYSCYACKTPQQHFEALAEDDGSGEYWTQPVGNGVDHFTENISCANCHVNDNPTQLNVLRADWQRAMGDDAATAPLQGQVCGQCHCDYSMAPTGDDAVAPYNDGEPTSPYYGGLDSMTPEKALEFYDEYNFADWTYQSTGAKMLAVRHAEYEFNYGGEGNYMTALGYNCNDCHMGVATADDGTTYTSHYWISPLENEELLANDCSRCHEDLVSEVKAIQDDIDGRTHLLGLRAEQYIFNLEDKVAIEQEVDGETALVFDMDTAKANGLSEDQVARLQQIQREACYWWNLAAAENSEGAHNPALYEKCIEQGNALLDEADEILGVDSHVDA